MSNRDQLVEELLSAFLEFMENAKPTEDSLRPEVLNAWKRFKSLYGKLAEVGAQSILHPMQHPDSYTGIGGGVDLVQIRQTIEPSTNRSRPFTPADWKIYSGAIKWSDDRGPLLRDVSTGRLLADKKAVFFYIGENTPEEQTWRLFREFVSQSEARAYLDSLPMDFKPLDHGFQNRTF